MKAVYITLAAAGVAAAQNIPNIPTCATKCLGEVAPKIDCESLDDYKCICNNMDKIMEQGKECFTDSCGEDKAKELQKTAEKLCSAFGGSDSGSGIMSIPESTANPTPSGSPTVSSGSGSGSGTPTPTGTSGMTSAMTSATTPGGGSGGGSGGSGSSDGPSKTDGGSGSTGTDSANPTSTTDGGDGDNAAGKPVAGVAAAALAMLAAL